MSRYQLLVETSDLRRALRATAPFLPKGDVDTSSPFGRVRATATETVTYFTVTDGSAGALSLVSTVALSGEGGETLDTNLEFDLSPTDVKKILTCFPGRDGKDGEPGDELRFDIDTEHLTVVDASGLFEGQSLVLGRLPALEHNANVLATFRHFIEATPVAPAEGVVASLGPSLAKVVAASKVYGPSVLLEQHARPDGRTTVLARIGESFLAVLVEAYLDDEAQVAVESWRDAWWRRLQALPHLSLSKGK